MTHSAASRAPSTRGVGWLEAAAAPGFVFLWSTGFIGAKYGLPYAEPLTFLSVRFALAVALLAAAAAIWRRAAAAAPRPIDLRLGLKLATVGALVHGVYLGGVFSAIALGLDAGLAALIASLGPVFAALSARVALGERLSASQAVGMALGLAGVAVALRPDPSTMLAGGGAPLFLCFAAAVAFGVGTVRQRALGPTDVVAGNAVQYAAAFAIVGLGALAFETREIQWTGAFVFALAWLTLALSLGAITLYYALLRRGAAAKAASLVFLTPATTAAIAWAMFGETLDPLEIAGFVLAAFGVALTTERLKITSWRTLGRR